MFDFTAPVAAGFNADFALCVMLPLAEAAYAVMEKPGVVPVLPPGFQMTGLIQADETLRQAILDLPTRSNVAKAMMDDSGIFGLLGNNPSTKNRLRRLPRNPNLRRLGRQLRTPCSSSTGMCKMPARSTSASSPSMTRSTTA